MDTLVCRQEECNSDDGEGVVILENKQVEETNQAEEDEAVLIAEEDEAVLITEEDEAVLITEEDEAVLIAEEDGAVLIAEEDEAVLIAEEDEAVLIAEEEQNMELGETHGGTERLKPMDEKNETKEALGPIPGELNQEVEDDNLVHERQTSDDNLVSACDRV